MKVIRHSVARTAFRASAQSGLNDLLSYVACVCWFLAILRSIASADLIAGLPVASTLLLASDTLNGLVLGGPLSLVQALAIHALCIIISRLPNIGQGLIWLTGATSAGGLYVAFVANVAMNHTPSVPGVVALGFRSVLYILLLASLFWAAVATIRSRWVGPRTLFGAALKLLGVPSYAWRAERGRISNVLEWCVAGLLHGALAGAFVVAAFKWSAVCAFGLGFPFTPTWSAIAAAITVLIVAHLFAAVLKVAARSGLAANLQDLSYRISSPDILYLRPFNADKRSLAMKASSLEALFPRRHWSTTVEQVLLMSAPQKLAISAIGQPEAEAAQLGASRAFAANETWQRMVMRGLETAKRVVLVVDSSPGIRWEIDQIGKESAQGKTMLVFEPGLNESEALAHARRIFSLENIDPLEGGEKPLAIYTREAQIIVVTGRHLNEFEYAAAIRDFLSEPTE